MATDEEDYILHGPSLNYVTEYTSAGKFIFERLRRAPEFIGQIEAHTGHRYSYAEILDRSIRLALWFRKMNIRPGDVVSYVTLNHKDVIIVVYATLFVGAILNPWEAEITSEEMAYFMDRTKPKMVICSKEATVAVKTAAEKLNITPIFMVHGKLSGFISFEDTQIYSKTDHHNFQCTEVDENDIAQLVCANGSSALPKIIRRTHKSILIAVYRKALRHYPYVGSVFITFSPISWVTGINAALWGPSVQFQHVLAPYFDEELAWKWIEQYRVNSTVISTISFLRMIYSCNAISNHDISSFRVAIVGGTPLLSCHYKKFEEMLPVGFKVLQSYGMAETVGIGALQTMLINPGSCGSLCLGVSAKIVDPHNGKTISPYEQGEICLKYPGMFAGYHHDSTLTQSTIDSDGWFHTGDLGKFDKKKELFVIDRVQDMIDVDGFKVSPSELEGILENHPGVEYVGVVAKRVSSNVKHPVAFVTKTPGSNVTEEELCIFLKDQTAADGKKLRGDVRFISKMPRCTSGKLKRWELRNMLELET